MLAQLACQMIGQRISPVRRMSTIGKANSLRPVLYRHNDRPEIQKSAPLHHSGVIGTQTPAPSITPDPWKKGSA